MLRGARRSRPARWVVLVLATGLAACGGGSGGVAVRVGAATISREAIDHYALALAGGHVPADAAKQRALREQALNALISSQWLVGEAAEQHLRLSSRELERQFDAKRNASFPGGQAEFREFLKQTGQTVANLMLEAKAELVASRLRQMLTSNEPPVAHAQVVAYYNAHRPLFVLPERRQLEATNRKHEAEADALKQEVMSGKRSFASVAPLRDTTERPKKLLADDKLEQAIYSAKLNVLVGPVKQRVDYYLLEVTQIIAPRQQSLAEVEGSIAKQLAAEQQKARLAAFISAWRSRWIARTDCSPGYVVQKCRQYAGVRAPEGPVAFN